MKKQNIMPVAVLTAICVVVAALLAVVNMFTAPVIKANAERAEQESLIAVMPGAEGFTEVKDITLSGSVTALYKENSGKGYVALLKTNTSYTHGTDMAITVGIGSDGKITGVKLTAYSESKDIGKNYPSSFVGLDSAGADKVDTVSGVTYSSNAFKNAIKDAFAIINPLVGNGDSGADSGKDTETLEAEALISGSDLKDVTPAEKADGVLRAWEDKNGGGYVVSVATKTEYVNPDTKTLVAVGNDGKIIGINILTWVHGQDIGYTDKFVSDFAGKDSAGIDGIDTITGATTTADNIKSAAKLAIKTVEEIKAANEISNTASSLISGSKLVMATPADKADGVETVWYDKNGGGYVVSVTTKTQYVNPDTRTLVAVDNDGKIIGIKILTWVHGQNIGYTDKFVSDFSGKDSAGIDGIDTITGATTTADNVKSAAKLAISAAASVKANLESVLASGMISGSDVADVTPAEKADGVDRVWYDKNSGGYVVSVMTKTQYVNPDTKTLVAVGNDGKIIGIEIITWVHGEGIQYTDKFVTDFENKDSAGVDGIDTITGATTTANNVKSAAKLAIKTVEEMKSAAALKVAAESMISGSELLDITPSEKAEGVINVWSDKNGGGYVVNVTTKTQYVNPDTQTLVAIGNDGRVIGIKILKWVHGEGVQYTDKFVSDFSGKDSAGIDGIDTITGATTTADNVKSAVKLAIEAVNAVKGGN